MINLDDRIFDEVQDENQMWLLLHIAKRINKDMYCFPTNYTLSKDCGWGMNKVQKVKKQLKDLGLIDVSKRMVQGRQRANNYTVNTDHIGIYVPLKRIKGSLNEGNPKEGTLKQGNLNEHTLNEGNRSINQKEVLTNTSINKKEEDKQSLPPAPSKEDQVKEVLSYLTKKSGNKFRIGKQFKESEKYKLIAARLQDFTIEELKQVVDVKSKEWAESAEWCKRLVPKTLFRASNFERYLDEADNSAPKDLFSQDKALPESETQAKTLFDRFCKHYKNHYETIYTDQGQSIKMARLKIEEDIRQLEPNPLDPSDGYAARIAQIKTQFPNLYSKAYNAR